MAAGTLSAFLRSLAHRMAAESLADRSDRQLVERALAGGDEAVFRAIVHRHGAMVYRVCRRVLRHDQDAEDAFQATFLVLAQKLRSLRRSASLASWLHGVAHRAALNARARASTRRRHEREAAPAEGAVRVTPAEDLSWRELRAVLDTELGELPERWRQPLILCYLEGRTQDEAAEQLGWSKNTLRTRLEEARNALGRRLTRRGVVWSAALAAVLLSDCATSAAPPSGLVASAVQAAARTAAGRPAGEVVSAQTATLAQGVLNAMLVTKRNTALAGVLILGLLAVGAGLGTLNTTTAAQQNPPTRPPVPEKKVAPGAVDLTKIDRTIRKEPAYAGKPRYALLVFGPRAEQRMWLVIDGETLYVDRDGDGDLTGAGEQLGQDKRETKGIRDVLEFHLGPFVEADGRTNHSDLVVTQYLARQYGHLVNTVSVRDVHGTFGQCANGEDGCAFAESARDAPVIHFNGPLTLRAYRVWVEYAGGTGKKLKEVSESGGLIDFRDESNKGGDVPYPLKPGDRVSQLNVQVGTPGLGTGAFAAIAVEKGFPAELHPRAAVVLPGRADPKKVVTAEFPLEGRCCGTQFHGPVRLPSDAGEGVAVVTLSFPGWAVVAPAVLELPLVGPPPVQPWGAEGNRPLLLPIPSIPKP